MGGDASVVLAALFRSSPDAPWHLVRVVCSSRAPRRWVYKTRQTERPGCRPFFVRAPDGVPAHRRWPLHPGPRPTFLDGSADRIRGTLSSGACPQSRSANGCDAMARLIDSRTTRRKDTVRRWVALALTAALSTGCGFDPSGLPPGASSGGAASTGTGGA